MKTQVWGVSEARRDEDGGNSKCNERGKRKEGGRKREGAKQERWRSQGRDCGE